MREEGEGRKEEGGGRREEEGEGRREEGGGGGREGGRRRKEERGGEEEGGRRREKGGGRREEGGVKREEKVNQHSRSFQNGKIIHFIGDSSPWYVRMKGIISESIKIRKLSIQSQNIREVKIKLVFLFEFLVIFSLS